MCCHHFFGQQMGVVNRAESTAETKSRATREDMPAELTKEQVQVQNLIAGCNACDRHAYSHRLSLVSSAVPRSNGAETLVFGRQMPTRGSGERPPREGRARPNHKTDAPTSVLRRKANPNHEEEGPTTSPDKEKPNTNLKEEGPNTNSEKEGPTPSRERGTHFYTPNQLTLQARRAIPH